MLINIAMRGLALVVVLIAIDAYMVVTRYHLMHKVMAIMAKRLLKRILKNKGLGRLLDEKQAAIQTQFEFRDELTCVKDTLAGKAFFAQELSKREALLDEAWQEMNLVCGLAFLSGEGKRVTKFIKNPSGN